MFNKHSASFLIFLIVFSYIAIGCTPGTPSAEKEAAAITASAQANAAKEVGYPGIVNYAEMKMAKNIFELRDRTDLIMYAYTYNEHTGQFHFLGRCLGYGLPYSVQYTSPEKVVSFGSGSYRTKLPQPDPNMLYMPEGLSATWLNLIDERTGDTHVMYVEPLLTVSPIPLPHAVYPRGVKFAK